MTMSGLVCPGCSGTFRAGFVRCSSCELELVDPSVVEDMKRKLDSPRAALEGVPRVAVVHAGIAACREIERAILDAGIPCFVEADAGEGEGLSPGALKVGVVVAESDLARVGELLRRRFEDLVAREGVGSFSAAAIDLSADEVECPACGHRGALAEGACGDCGLFLGAPEV
jgi:hypothetical protein